MPRGKNDFPKVYTIPILRSSTTPETMEAVRIVLIPKDDHQNPLMFIVLAEKPIYSYREDICSFQHTMLNDAVYSRKVYKRLKQFDTNNLLGIQNVSRQDFINKIQSDFDYSVEVLKAIMWLYHPNSEIIEQN